MGLLFPPSILAGSLVGGAAAGLAAKLWDGMSRTNLKEIGEVLDDYHTGLIIVGESTLDELVEKALNKAQKRVRKELAATCDELEKDL